MTFGSLFAGIGGMDLGLERAGMMCKWQVEIDPYARRVLEKHWPDVRRWTDVRTLFNTVPQSVDEWRVDLIAGGFPCQDLSYAGHGSGLDGSRSGLWWEMLRIVCAIRPRFVIVENTPGLLTRGLDRILGSLAESGFDAEWSIVSACSLGAPHTRERLFIVAHADSINGEKRLGVFPDGKKTNERRSGRAIPNDWIQAVTVASGINHGVSAKLDGDRIRCLGNSVAPDVAEWIGRRILESINGAKP